MKFLDSKWFVAYQNILESVGETYDLLDPSPGVLAKRLATFEASGFTDTPDLTSDKPRLATLEKATREAQTLQSHIASQETNDLVRDTYLPAIDALRLNIQLISAGARGDMDAYRHASEQLYGQPDRTIFEAACAWIRDDALTTSVGHSDLLTKLCDDVLEAIPRTTVDYHTLIPSEATFTAVKQSHIEYYKQLFGPDGLPNDPYIDEARGNDICRQVLKNIGSDYSLAPSDNNLWAVLPSRKQVIYPSGYRLDRDEFVGIVCHEIGSHVLETVNGARSPLQLLGTGLAGFEKGNEGRAFLREQIVYPHEHTFLRQFSWEYIVLLHISVSLAAGLDKQPYDFPKLYGVLFRLYYFWRERREPRATNNEAFARQEAWFLAVRVLKGTPGDGSAAYLKDTVYLEGNVKCWQLATKDTPLIIFGDQGKYDISNPAHLQILRKLYKVH